MWPAWARATMPSTRVEAASSASRRNVCTSGPGVASPEHSTTRWENRAGRKNLRLRARRSSAVVRRSSRTSQQMQPFRSSTTRSLAPTTSSPSMPSSPNSLTMTAVGGLAGSESHRFRSVVFPAPRKPLRIVTGRGGWGKSAR